MSKKRKQVYPAGWDEQRVRKLAELYDNQTEAEQVAEHEAAFLAEGQTILHPLQERTWWFQVLAWHESHHHGQAHLTLNLFKNSGNGKA